MFSSSFFAPEYFNEFFKITGDVIIVPDRGGSGSKKAIVVNYDAIRKSTLRREDQEILEFVVAFVMSRSNEWDL